MQFHIIDLLERMVKEGVSDLHIKAGSPPGFRKDGHIVQLEEYGDLTPELSRELAGQLMTTEQAEVYDQEKDLDFSYAVPDCARFRVNVLTQRDSCGMVIRQIPDSIPSVTDLGLPQICMDLALKPRGLVLVTGPTGSGKSTTLAAMIDYINENEQGHILTMEDPLEFIHPDKKCYVTQRQIGSDTKSFEQGLRRALRQDPDVILIGEMRDLETISMAITAAETGHLVFGTLHTTSAISTVDRIIDVFPPDAQQQIRVQLSGTLQAVLSQCLVPKVGGGRVAAREIMIATDGVRSLIREGKSAQLLNILQTGSSHGMSTLEQELVDLVNKGVISLDDGIGKANRPADVQRYAKPPAGGHQMQDDFGGGMGGGARKAPSSAPARAPANPQVRPQSAVAKPRPAPGGMPSSDDGAPLKRRGGLFGKK